MLVGSNIDKENQILDLLRNQPNSGKILTKLSNKALMKGIATYQ